MKDFFKYLMNWEHKTPLIAFLMSFITFATDGTNPLFSDTFIMWADFIGGALVLIGKDLVPTGSLPKGWSNVLWITNIGAILIGLGAYFIDSGLFNEKFALSVVYGQTVITSFIGAAQMFFALKGSKPAGPHGILK
jgi:hypothetical protein